MSTNSHRFLLIICLLTAGFLTVPVSSAIPSSTSSSQTINKTTSLDEDKYFQEVILPARDAGTLTVDQREFLIRYKQKLVESSIAGARPWQPRRDDRGGPLEDEFNYEWRDSNEEDGPVFAWLDITENEGVVEVRMGDDTSHGPYELGFEIEYYDNVYDECHFCSNGWASFTSDLDNYRPEGQLPNGDDPENMLAVIFTDFDPSMGGMGYYWAGEHEGQNVAVYTWENIPHIWDENWLWTFQIIISDDGMIKYQYLETDQWDDALLVGNQNADRDMGFTMAWGENYPEAEMAVMLGNNWIEFEEDPGIAVRPEAIDFGDVFVDQTESVMLIVSNIGAENLVIDDISVDNEVFGVPELGEELIIESGRRTEFEITFTPDAADEFAGEVTIHSNAVNADEDGNTLVPLAGRGLLAPDIDVDPLFIETELNTGDSEDHEIRVANTGNSDLAIDVGVEVTAEPGDERGPRRDQPEAHFAFFRDEPNWWGDFIAIWDEEEADWDHLGSGDFEDFDIDDYDAIWICEFQPDNFNVLWNESRERFEDWVDHGGVLYHGTGTNNWNVTPVHVGGLERIQQGSGNGQVAVTNDPDEDNYNYLAELIGWEGGEILPGGSWSHASYDHNDMQDIDNSDYYQVIAHAQGNDNQIGVAVYSYGRGWSIVSGTTDSHQYSNYRNEGNWGDALHHIIWYMD